MHTPRSPLTAHRLLWGLVTAGLLVGVRDLAGQTAPPLEVRTTRAGVYTSKQASRGSELYALNCQSCHTAASHTSPAFVAKWQGRPLADLLAYMREEMPKSDPGSLTARQYTLLLAYLLKMNGMPAGPEELPGDSLALAKIHIDFKAPEPPQER
jgi:mono/diheme cytochrome c family protein